MYTVAGEPKVSVSQFSLGTCSHKCAECIGFNPFNGAWPSMCISSEMSALLRNKRENPDDLSNWHLLSLLNIHV